MGTPYTKRGKGKEKKGKKANFEIVPKNSPAEQVLTRALKWHDELVEARIALAWRKETKADKDGRIVLGRCMKVSDLHKEFAEFDFIVVLNLEYWNAFDEEKRLALMDHELCHAAPSINDKSGIQNVDEKGRLVWRVRKHDVEEFRCVVERHGCYKGDLEAFANALRDAQERQPQLSLLGAHG